MNPLKGVITPKQLADFCERWKIIEIIAYEPIRDAATSDNQLEFMLTLRLGVPWNLLDHVAMEYELTDLTGCPVNIVDKRHVETSEYWNGLREQVFKTAQVMYVGG